MVNYEQMVNDVNTLIDRICTDVENIDTNEDLGNILDVSTTEWGYIKALLGHLDDLGASILGAARLARVTACIAIAEAKD